MSNYVGRLAPSPTGVLHLGNARTFLITWLHCRAHGGEMLMRMEDLNIARLKPWAVQAAYDELYWLGLDWNQGAGLETLGKNKAVKEDDYVQTACLSRYKEAFEFLREKDLIYPCSCSRKDIQEAQSAPHQENELRYPGTCRGRWKTPEDAKADTGREPSWRFRINDEQKTKFNDGFFGLQQSKLFDWSGDFVLARSIDEIGYQLAVVVDDAHHGVTQVIRADDLMMSTHRQLVLYEALSLKAPEFLHLPLVVGDDGRRLAKRHGDWKLSALREAGVSTEKLIGYLAYTCGWAKWGEEIMPLELEQRFDIQSIPKEPVVIDKQVLNYFGVS